MKTVTLSLDPVRNVWLERATGFAVCNWDADVQNGEEKTRAAAMAAYKLTQHQEVDIVFSHGTPLPRHDVPQAVKITNFVPPTV